MASLSDLPNPAMELTGSARQLILLSFDSLASLNFEIRKQAMTIKQIEPDLAPFHLLILADPSAQRIHRYLHDGIVFIGEHSDAAVAVAVCKLCDDEFELHNISVSEIYQGQGFGSQMLLHIFRVAESFGAKCVTVGTGNSSLRQLSFYQKAGFRISGVIPNYFINDVPQIFENGIRCIDMIRLRYEPRA